MKIFLILLFSAMMISNCYALTDEQLLEAKATIKQMERKLRTIKTCVNIAISGKAGIVDINAEQKTDLIELYQNSKTELQTLYQELP